MLSAALLGGKASRKKTRKRRRRDERMRGAGEEGEKTQLIPFGVSARAAWDRRSAPLAGGGVSPIPPSATDLVTDVRRDRDRQFVAEFRRLKEFFLSNQHLGRRIALLVVRLSARRC